MLAVFGAKVSAYDPYVEEKDYGGISVSRADSLEDLFETSEILFECSGLTPETEGIVNRDMLARLPDDATFINVARGQLVDQEALIDELRAKRLRAGLDVFREEPVPEDSPLRGLAGLVVMPHLGALAQETFQRSVKTAMDNIHRYVNNQDMLFEVTLHDYDRMT